MKQSNKAFASLPALACPRSRKHAHTASTSDTTFLLFSGTCSCGCRLIKPFFPFFLAFQGGDGTRGSCGALGHCNVFYLSLSLADVPHATLHHLLVRLLRAEDPVARVAQAGQDVAFLVQALVHVREVDLDVGVLSLNRLDALG